MSEGLTQTLVYFILIIRMFSGPTNFFGSSKYALSIGALQRLNQFEYRIVRLRRASQ